MATQVGTLPRTDVGRWDAGLLNWVATVRLVKVVLVALVVHPVSVVVEQPEVHCCQVTEPELPLKLKLPPAPEQTEVVPVMLPGVVLYTSK